VEKALIQMDRLASRSQLAVLEQQQFSIQPSSYCCVCKKRFEVTSGFVRYPNGVLTHSLCAKNKNVCPLTGRLFHVETKN
jgi:hypothetical protein